MTEGDYSSVTVQAGQDFRVAGMLHKAVTFSGVIAAAGSSTGLAKSQPNSGQHLNVGYAGHMKAYAGAAINAGAKVSNTASGWMIAAVSGSLGSVGRAIEAANSGDLFSGIFDFATGATAN